MQRHIAIAILLTLLALFVVACNETGDGGADGDVSDGDVSDGDIADGDIEDGDVTDGDSADGDITDGDITDGDTQDGDIEDGDVEDGDVTDGDTTDGDIEDGDITDGDTTDGDLPVCEEAIAVKSVSGSVVDTDDTPIESALALMCLFRADGSSACLNPVSSDSEGHYTVTVTEAHQCMARAAVRFLAPDNPLMTSISCPVDLGNGGAVEIAKPTKLGEATPNARDRFLEGRLRHGIRAGDGTELSVIPDGLSLYDATYEDIHMLPWNTDEWGWPCFVDPENPPDALIAIVPEIIVSTAGAAQISFPNVHNLAAGEHVDIYGLGSIDTYLQDGTQIEEGDWQIIGEAIVSDDGSSISTPQDGDGLPFLTWLGYKRR